MELILWRHAEAEPHEVSKPDAERALTSKGKKQALRMGEWLDRHLPENCRILSSPAVRTVQTVEALHRKYKTHVSLSTDSTAEAILEAANWPNSKEPVLIVGHQPTLGHVATLLLNGVAQDWTMRKGSICWIAQKADDEIEATYIKAILGADLAAK